MPTTIAYQGEPGAFSELAAHRHFGAAVRTLPCVSFAAVFDALRRGRAQAGLLPVENTVFGPIHETRDHLAAGGFVPFGEITLRIRMCLLGRPGSTLSRIRTVVSQPQALGQCGRFLLAHDRIRVQPVTDTAAAARMVGESADPALACIAGRQTARPHGLKLLREGIEDQKENFTRFLAIRKGRPTGRPSGRGPMTTMVVASVTNRPGSLHRLLGAFATSRVDLRSITARPQPGRPWEYVFHLDLAGSPSQDAVAAALDEARKVSILVRVLGAFPRGRTVQR